MERNEFWSIIEAVKDNEVPSEALETELAKLEPHEIISYQKHFDTLHERAYSWALWGAAYLMEDGCSDDGFIDFRYGLISKGKDVYKRALMNPDSLAEMCPDEEISDESFGYVALDLFERKTGKEIKRKKSEQADEPEGEEWDFDDPEENKKRLPQLAKLFG